MQSFPFVEAAVALHAAICSGYSSKEKFSLTELLSAVSLPILQLSGTARFSPLFAYQIKGKRCSFIPINRLNGLSYYGY